MQGNDLALVVGSGVFLVLAAGTGRSFWQNEIGWNADRPPRLWPLGLPLWRGLNRSVGLNVPFFAFCLLISLGSSLNGSAWEWVAAIGAAGLFVALVLMVTIVLLGRPAALIPPHLRHQPGLVAEYLGAEVQRTPPPEQTLLRD